MREQQHLVQKYTFDVGFDSESKAYSFQNDLISYIKEKIVALTDEVFSEVSVNKEISIPKLTIDLGNISYQNYEEEIYNRLKDQLTDKLNLLISGFHTNDLDEKVEFISYSQSQLKTFEYFLVNGYFPWSARRSDSEVTPSKILSELISENPDSVKKLLSSILLKEEIKLRLIRQNEDELLWRVLKLWLDEEVEYVKKFFSELIKIYKKKKLLKNTYAEFRELVWKFLITQIIVHKKTNTDVAVITESFFRYSAIEVHVPFQQLIIDFVVAYSQSDSKIINPANLLLGEQSTNLPSSVEEAIVQIVQKSDNLVEFIKQQINRGILGGNLNVQTNRKNLNGEGIEIPIGEDTIESDLSEDQKQFEEYRKQRTERIYKFLIRFFNLANNINLRDFRPSELSRIESLIREFASSNPSLLRKVFSESGYDIRKFKGQYVLLSLSEDVRTTLLNQVLSISKDEFDSYYFEEVRKLILSFVETSYYPFESLPIGLTNSEWDALIQLVIDDADAIKEIETKIKETYFPIEENTSKVLRLNQSSPIIKKYFDSVFAQQSNKAKGKKEDLSKEKNIHIEDLNSTNELVHWVQYYVFEKSFPQNIKFSVRELAEKFYKSNKEVLVLYLNSLKEENSQVILQELSVELQKGIIDEIQKIKTAVKELRSDDNSELSNVSKEKPKRKDGGEKSKDPSYELKKIQSGEPIYINNAGLVIFHPYLNRFFKMLNLLDKREFKDEISAHKAAHLLQYLANKTINPEEHDLPLNKLICGIDLQVPLIRDIEITEEDKETCDSLIEGVIQNWTILKKTSIDNFRTSFLQREGRLVLEPKGWKLKVEERGYDILVEKIPWSIAMVRLPWMKNIIYVEWK